MRPNPQNIWSHLLKKSLMENFIFLCSVPREITLEDGIRNFQLPLIAFEYVLQDDVSVTDMAPHVIIIMVLEYSTVCVSITLTGRIVRNVCLYLMIDHGGGPLEGLLILVKVIILMYISVSLICV